MNGAFLYVLAGGVCLGILLSLLFTIPLFYAGALLFITALFLLGALFVRAPKVMLIAVALGALTLGVVRANIFLNAESQNNLNTFSGSAVVEGVVTNDPELSGSYVH